MSCKYCTPQESIDGGAKGKDGWAEDGCYIYYDGEGNLDFMVGYDCGYGWTGVPIEKNGFKYCPYCGEEIKKEKFMQWVNQEKFWFDALKKGSEEMKLLQNKLTNEIGCLVCSFGKTPEKITVVQYVDGKRGSRVWYYNSLAELNAEWEDYSEPDEFWFIQAEGAVDYFHVDDDSAFDKGCKSIGNYFTTQEEAMRAVERLKAWKRLKDRGFRFKDYERNMCDVTIRAKLYDDGVIGMINELDLLFGGEDE